MQTLVRLLIVWSSLIWVRPICPNIQNFYGNQYHRPVFSLMLSASVPSQLGISKKKHAFFSGAKRHLDSVVFKILRFAHLPYVFGSKCYGHLTK